MNRLTEKDLAAIESACFGSGTSPTVAIDIGVVRRLLATARRETGYAEALAWYADPVNVEAYGVRKPGICRVAREALKEPPHA
jgi:hypothetical protein